VERIVAIGKRNGDDKAVGPVARVIRDAVLSVAFGRMQRRNSDPSAWIYDWNPASVQ
jgi:FAD-dependent urate hydroxylase